jgi:hypothetical protein
MKDKESPERRPSKLFQIVFSTCVFVVSTALGFASVFHYRADAEKRTPVEAFVKRFHMTERRPEWARTVAVAPTADMGAEVAVDAALLDARGSVRLIDVDPATRQLWMELLPMLDVELDAARALLLEALRERPGWSYHEKLLGQIEYVRARRGRRLGVAPERWLRPLELAMASVPGDPSIATIAGTAILEAWPSLASVDMRQVRPILRKAFEDPDFVAIRYDDVAELLSQQEANALLPEDAACLRAAVGSETRRRHVAGAAALYPRWERAELRARADDLQKIVARMNVNDAGGMRTACRAWARSHSVWDFDNTYGRRQAARVLELWPNDAGSWNKDPRSDFVRFFVDRPKDVDGAAVARAATALTGVPLPVLARATLLSGDLYRAQSIAQSSDALGSFSWTRFQVDVAAYHLAAKRDTEAAEALTLISPSAQNECDVALTRRMLANATGAKADVDPAIFPVDYAAGMWSRADLPICIDPDKRARELIVDLIVANGPALVSVGFDQGRMGTVALPPGRSRIRTALGDRRGRHIFFYRTEVGGAVAPISGALR